MTTTNLSVEKCMSCGDTLHPFDGFHVSSKYTDKPGYRCGECYNELVEGVIENQNIHIIGAPETPKVNKLVFDWE